MANRNGRKFRAAVVGAGPSGLYAVRSLLESDVDVSVDVFDRLPAPYGLVRYGVAPDNQKMKSVTRVLCRSFEAGNDVRFFGNVVFGSDLTRDDLRAHYDAVVYATGTQSDRRLNIPGEDLPGSFGAKEFVEWYCGHPDASERDYPLHVSQIAVVGAGNVALDIIRMLAKSGGEIATTDVPDRVLETFQASSITDVHMLSRRGPAQAKFTPVELREMGELINADIVIHPEELVLTAEDEQRMATNRQLRTNVTLLQEWSQRPPQGKPRRVHMRFLRSPVRILGHDRIEQVVIERNALQDDGTVRGTGEEEVLDAQMVFRAVGYRAQALPDVPFDARTSTVPNREGRVVDAEGQPVPGEYVTGWAKRGPTGVIGTNKNDAAETVRSLLADLADSPRPPRAAPDELPRLLEQRGVQYVDWAAWLRLDAHETQLGQQNDRPRVKIPDLESMLKHAGGPGPA